MTAGEDAAPVLPTPNPRALPGRGTLLGSYDDVPLLPPDANPRPYLSRARVPQPFWVAPSTAAVLALYSGEVSLELREGVPSAQRLGPGDHASLPIGVPYRLVPARECLYVVYRLEPRGPETLLWYCPLCDTRLYPHVVEPARALPQRAYWAVVEAFNSTTDLRHCEYCGALHQPVNLSDLRWVEVAARLERGAGGSAG